MKIQVGGQTRKSGKTTLVCAILSAFPERRWTAAKISAHTHGFGPAVFEETEASPETDTGRYLLAGAARSFWVRGGADPAPILTYGPDVIVESNSALEWFRPDLFLIAVTGSDEWKPSAAERRPQADLLADDPAAAVAFIRAQMDRRSSSSPPTKSA